MGNINNTPKLIQNSQSKSKQNVQNNNSQSSFSPFGCCQALDNTIFNVCGTYEEQLQKCKKNFIQNFLILNKLTIKNQKQTQTLLQSQKILFTPHYRNFYRICNAIQVLLKSTTKVCILGNLISNNFLIHTRKAQLYCLSFSKYQSFLKKSLRYKLGYFYLGQMKNGKRHGIGRLINHEGQIYQGQWSENQPNGKGIYFSPLSMAYYQGYWKNSEQSGQGIEIYDLRTNDQIVAQQKVKRNLNKQVPKEITKEEQINIWLKSEASQNIKYAQYQINYKNYENLKRNEYSSKYQGSFVNGKKNGKGKLTFLNSKDLSISTDQNANDGYTTLYQGYFLDNAMQGQGTSVSRYHRYTGQFHNNKMHGNGQSIWYDSKGQTIGIYVGQYCDGLKHGYGQYIWDQQVYKGNWHQGEMANEGVLLNYIQK